MNDHQLNALRAEVNALLQQLQVHDQHLAASQGAAEALERVVNCLLLTHPDPGSVRAMISHNGPRLFEGGSLGITPRAPPSAPFLATSKTASPVNSIAVLPRLIRAGRA